VVEAAVLEAAATGRPTGRVLVKGGIISEDQLARIMAARPGLPYVDLTEFPVDRSLAGLIPQDAARRYAAVAVGQEANGRLLVAMADPSDVLALDDLRLLTEHAIQPAAASPEGCASSSPRSDGSTTPSTRRQKRPPTRRRAGRGVCGHGPECADGAARRVADRPSGAQRCIRHPSRRDR
jgi:hypothetical protein